MELARNVPPCCCWRRPKLRTCGLEDVALAAPVAAPARPGQRALRRPAHRHAPGHVVPSVVHEVGQVRAADGHELALHGGEEEGATVEGHGVLPPAKNAAGAGGAVVAGAAGVEQHGGLGRGERDGDDLVAVAGHGQARWVARVVALEPEPTAIATVAARSDAEGVGDGHVAALPPAPRRPLRCCRWKQRRCQQ